MQQAVRNLDLELRREVRAEYPILDVIAIQVVVETVGYDDMVQEKHLKEKNIGPRRDTWIPPMFKEEEKKLVEKIEKDRPEKQREE